MSPPADLREWIALLEREGELVRVSAEVDPISRGHGDRRPHRQGRRACASLREPEGLLAPAPHQPVRHRAAHVPRARRRQPRRRCRQARVGARDAAPAGPGREGPRPEDAEVDRRLAAEDRSPCGPSRRRARRRRRGSRSPADPALLAGRPRAVHHPPGRDHARPEDRHAQRRHVPHAEARLPLDGDALAAAQGRAHGLPGDRRPARGGRRARPRPDQRLLGLGAAPEAHRRVHARRVPEGRAGRARQGHDGRRRGARERGDRARGLRGAGRRDPRGPVRRPHGLLLGAPSRSRSST